MSPWGFSVEGVLDAVAAQAHRSGAGRAVMLVSARRKEGVTTAACAIAEAAGPGAVYAVDLDLKRNALAKRLSERAPLGPKLDGRVSGIPFYALRTAGNAPLRESAAAFGYHRVGHSRVHAGVFDVRALPAGARVAISAGSAYWDAARASGGYVVVDAPSLDRSEIALRVAPHMDAVVLVVGADRGAAPAATAAKAALDGVGANVIGLIYAGATAPVMAIEQLARQLG
ncbi:MAG TPA: hypothetical protein VEA80_05415 [Vitreimonas sp.]|uniref:hypothetical protein n=1 Tax=Vitreimonas sp. TaxID=3069702 RepID=UPI002D53E69A|nr:hypothetical protein [Vitreimonas sp.]HYD86891.1 hypothetical protein [Vitreimonas sp.]